MAFSSLVLLLLTAASLASANFPAKLVLERALPTRGVALEHLIARDVARHGRLLLGGNSVGVVDFPAEGSANPNTIGLYYTRVKLGNPPKEFYVQVDTGSDILWVTCNPCNGCPLSSGLNIPVQFYDPDSSSTVSKISCSSSICTSAIQGQEGLCSASDSYSSLCDYSFEYGDGSGTSGYYVSDAMYFDTVLENEQIGNSSAKIIFGCSNLQSGDLTKSDKSVNGIFGFGQRELSVISQLSSLGVVPKVFSHCLSGTDSGGGILVLGEIVEPGIVYTPLVKSQPHYNLNLETIAVNGVTLPIDSSLFSTSNEQGTIIDSGTTLAYLADQVYDPVVNAIVNSLSSSVRKVSVNGYECYSTPSSMEESFPSVTLNFMGGASMPLKPENYLLQRGSVDNSTLWCIGWQKNVGIATTLLGDIVLKDKIIVYDLANQRIGWTNYDCSLSVNVSTSSGKNEYLNTGELDVSGTSNLEFARLLLSFIALILMYICNPSNDGL